MVWTVLTDVLCCVCVQVCVFVTRNLSNDVKPRRLLSQSCAVYTEGEFLSLFPLSNSASLRNAQEVYGPVVTKCKFHERVTELFFYSVTVLSY